MLPHPGRSLFVVSAIALWKRRPNNVDTQLDCQLCLYTFCGDEMPKGRPALSGVRKLGVLQIRHTDAERALLDAAAALSGKPTSTWARDTLLQIATFTVAQQADAEKKPAKKPASRTVRNPKPEGR